MPQWALTISQLTSVYRLRGCCLQSCPKAARSLSRGLHLFIHAQLFAICPNCRQSCASTSSAPCLLILFSILSTAFFLIFCLCLLLCWFARAQLSSHLQVGSQAGERKMKREEKKVQQDRIKLREQSNPSEPTARNIICNTCTAAHTFTLGSFKQF